MDKKVRVLLTFGILVLLILGFYLVSYVITKYTGYSITGRAVYSKEEQVQIGKCLTNKGVVLYCVDSMLSLNCLRQKRNLGKAFEYMSYIDCSESENLEQCRDLSLPAWKIGKRIYYGIYDLGRLAEVSGCEEWQGDGGEIS